MNHLATIKNKTTWLLFIVYLYLVLINFLCIYALGCFTFKPDIQAWIYRHWDYIKQYNDYNSLVKFM